MAKTKRAAIHYVNNKEFSQAVVDYCKELDIAKENGEELPIVPTYIADCFMRIAEGLSHKSNFVRYTYRDEMVMDAVENCLRAVHNYNVHAATRTGLPNAFAYFTQISWYAFLRRIEKEKKQQDIKQKYLSQSGIDSHLEIDMQNPETSHAANSIMNTLNNKADKIKETTDDVYQTPVRQKKRAKRSVSVDSDLRDFME